MNSNTKYLLTFVVAVILVAGALTLPFINDHTADAKKKKKYKGKSQKVSFENEVEMAAVAAMADQVLEVRAEAAPQVPAATLLLETEELQVPLVQ